MSLSTNFISFPSSSTSGGLTLAHGGPSHHTLSQHIPKPQFNTNNRFHSNTTPLHNINSLSSNIIDKTQRRLTLRICKSTSHYPIISVDLYDMGHVAYFPSLEGINDVNKSLNKNNKKDIPIIIIVKHVGKLQTSLMVKSCDVSYKAMKQYLKEGCDVELYDNLVSSSLVTKKEKTNNNDNQVINDTTHLTIPKPYFLLGARNTGQLHETVKKKYTLYNKDIIKRINHVFIKNNTLDGCSIPQHNDDDRVSFGISFKNTKKCLHMLPEECLSLVLMEGHKLVNNYLKTKMNQDTDKDNNVENDSQEYYNYPMAISVPAWACHDSSMEALLDAVNSNGTVLYQRSVSALAGALIAKNTQVNHHTKTLNMNMSKLSLLLHQNIQNQMMKNRSNNNMETLTNLVIMFGLTEEGIEVTAIRVGGSNNQELISVFAHVPFRDLDVIGSVSYIHPEPHKIIEKCIHELISVIDEKDMELQETGIVAIVTYGSITKQVLLKNTLSKLVSTMDHKKIFNDQIPILSTREECVACGTAILAANSHGRLKILLDSKKSRSSMTVKNVVTVALGIQCHFHNETTHHPWTEPKILFHHDQRITARSYRFEFNAAECVAMKQDPSLFHNQEQLVQEAKKWSHSKHNLKRVDAAFDFRVQVVQRLEKGGSWVPVGNFLKPLVLDDENEEDLITNYNENNEQQTIDRRKVTIEEAVLELNLDHMGLIMNALIREGKSIDQSIKAAKSSKFYHYFRVFLAILFFGGFLIKSFMEDIIAKRDVERILKFYKHVLPGSFSDGDKNNARYLVWKYRGQMEKLWKKLETKYGVPVLHSNEWDDYLYSEEKINVDRGKSAQNVNNNNENYYEEKGDSDL